MGFFQDITGVSASRAANQAALDTYNKQLAAAQGLRDYGNTLPGQYNQIATAYDPYRDAGTSALSRLMGGLGLSGPDQQTAFTNAYHNLPGYESGLATGQQAAERGLNAGGGLRSGGALKALYRYGSNYEDQRAGDYLGRLGGLAGQGLGATNAATGLQAQGVGANTGLQSQAAGMQYGSAPTIGQGLVAGAQSQQDASSGLLKTGASLLGSILGGPIGGQLGSTFLGGSAAGTPVQQQAFWNQGNVGPATNRWF